MSGRRTRSGGCLLRCRSPDDRLNLLARNGVGPQIDHIVHADAIGPEDLQDLHQRAGLTAALFRVSKAADEAMKHQSS